MNQNIISSVGVAIPVHDEEALLPGCLDSISSATAGLDLPVRVVVALDRCQDRSIDAVTASRANGLDVRAVYPDRPGVGAARAAGIQALLADADPDSTWLATTDADSFVPPHWLSRQLEHAQLGADVVIGTVRVSDWSDHPPSVRDSYLAGYHARPGHSHRHGANLSFRGRRYLDAGGFQPFRTGEDVDLISRFEQVQAVLVWAADVEVSTSGRRIGRAPDGFADFLLGLEEVT